MRKITATLLVASLFVSNAFAAPQAIAPLPAGKPAGVNQAAVFGPSFGLILVGLGVVIGGLVLASSNASGGVTSPTTSTTNTGGLP